MLIGKAMMEHEKNVITSLRQKGMQGGKEWYRFLRNEKVSEDETIHKILVNGVEITEKTEMIKEIEAFWRDITTKKEDTEAINTNLISMKRCEDEYELKKLIRDIDITEVEKSLKDAKNNKAPGIDTIPYEMYKHGGKTTTRTLMELFNDVWEKEEIPEDWNVSKVKLQHKGGYKSKLLLKNYRPISLTNTMGKLFANIISSRLVEWIERNEIIGEEQNGFRPDRRATDNIFTVNEIIDKKLKEKKKVYICFLDIEKAYDKVDREMMLAVLESIGLPRKIINIIRKLYSNTYATYKLMDLGTKLIKSTRGVRQGCILSSTLFNLYTEELATRTNKGIQMKDSKINALFYADDIILLSESAEDMQEFLDITTTYARNYLVDFGYEKCNIMIVNKTEEDKHITWNLKNKEITLTSDYIYLGVWINENGQDKTMQEKIALANSWMGRLASAAKMRTCKYETIREVWKTIAVPAIMYGMEAISVKDSDIERLETIQNKVARISLNAPKYVANETLRGDMGWSTFKERNMKACLTYKWRLECMKENRSAKQAYNDNNWNSKWNKKCKKMLDQCGFPAWKIITQGYGIRPRKRRTEEYRKRTRPRSMER